MKTLQTIDDNYFIHATESEYSAYKSWEAVNQAKLQDSCSRQSPRSLSSGKVQNDVTSLDLDLYNELSTYAKEMIEKYSRSKNSKCNKKWFESFQELVEFKERNGHCTVLRRNDQQRQLSLWMNTQRSEYKKMLSGKSSCMKKERVKLLDKLGFEWFPNQWEDKYDELVEYKKKNGDCNVPQGYGPNKQLAQWVTTQRNQYSKKQAGKPSQMTRERIMALERIGFEWEREILLHKKWHDRFHELMKFKERHGHCNVPQRYSLDQRLASWVNTQRQQYSKLCKGKTSHLIPERFEMLQQIGFEFSPSDKIHDLWQHRYEELIDYKKLHGHCNVPQRNDKYKKLAAWINSQRYHYKRLYKNNLTQPYSERIMLLEKIGFEWTVDRMLHDVWQKRYEELVEFKKQHGHCDVPQSHHNNKKLACWVYTQRHQYKRMQRGKSSSMVPERIAALEKLDFDFSPNLLHIIS